MTRDGGPCIVFAAKKAASNEGSRARTSKRFERLKLVWLQTLTHQHSDSTLGAALAGVVMHTKRERRGWRVTTGRSACGSGRGPSRLRRLADPCRRCRPLGAAHVLRTRSQSARRSRLQWSPARSRTRAGPDPGPSAPVGHGGTAAAQGPAPAAAR